jgi:DMSO/TMAO reductase YedYZ heme-binding membrane subunit
LQVPQKNSLMNAATILSINLKKWLWYLSLPGMTLTILLGIFQTGEPAGFSALVGITLLAVTLLPAAFVRLNWWKGNPYLRFFVKYQRDLGIMAGLWFITHGATSSLFFFKRDQPWLVQFKDKALQPTWIMLPVMILLLITSIKTVQKATGGTWKKIHSLIWLLPFLMIMHGNLAIATFEKEDFAPASIVLILFIVVAFGDAIKNRTFTRILLIIGGLLLSWMIWWI